MSNFTAIVDVAIGLSLIYLGVSLYVTIVNEIVARWLQLRGKQLAGDLLKLIDEPNLQGTLAASPALAPFFAPNGNPGLVSRLLSLVPFFGRKVWVGSYVDADIVARLLLGALQGSPTADKDDGKEESFPEVIKGAIEKLPASKLRTQLQALAETAATDVETFVGEISHWVDQSLTMMGEVYKQRIAVISFFIGLAAAVAFNIQSLAVADYLYRNKEAREAIVVVAEQFTDATSKATFDRCLKAVAEGQAPDADCKSMIGLVTAVQGGNETFGQLPVLWKDTDTAWEQIVPFKQDGWLFRLVGWLITALAVSLGAPFWFDLLNKLVNIRRAVQPRKTS